MSWSMGPRYYQQALRRSPTVPAARPNASKAEAAASNSSRGAALASRERVQLNADDAERYEFIRALDAAEVYVTDWEAQFIASLLKEVRPLTPAQQRKVDQMQQEYGHQVPAISRQPSAVSRAMDRSPAVPGECAYFVRDETGQHRCGLPATQRSGNIELCDDHKRAQEEGLARMKTSLRPRS